MCGIFGISLSTPLEIRDVVEYLTTGLKLLAYRGYDSAGLSLQTTSGESIICKSEGHVETLCQKTNGIYSSVREDVKCVLGIAHTRWATHGRPSDTNSHPHVSDKDMTFTVVHNGIITNYQELKDIITSSGESFESDTDTEVIPKLLLLHRKANPDLTFPQLVDKVVRTLQGSFALLIQSSLFPQELVACRQSSPLIVGLRDDTVVFSSDMSALVECQKVCVMKDGYQLHVARGTISTTSPLLWEENKVSLEDVQKGHHCSFMHKEIFEQPLSLRKTIFFTEGEVREFFTSKELIQKIERADAIVLIGCGTSYHSCLASKYLLQRGLDKLVLAESAASFAESEPKVFPTFVYFFVSQSGETADTLDALRYVRNRCPSATCVGVTNKQESSIARDVDYSICLHAGVEISVASTKAYTSQLTVLLMLLGISGRDIYQSIQKVPFLVQETLLKTCDKTHRLAADLLKFNSLLFVGRGADYATCLEAALKVKEISYIHSEGILAGELKHGPLAMIDKGVGVVVFVVKNSFYQKMVSVVEQLKSRQAEIFAVCSEGDETLCRLLPEENLLYVPHTEERLQHIINVIPMQLLAFHLAKLKGNSVDQPRNLAKSVTVSD